MKILVLYQDIDGGTKNATEAIVQKLKMLDPSVRYRIYKQPDAPRTNWLYYTRHLIWSIWDFWRTLQRERHVDVVYFTIFSAAIAKALSRQRNTPGFFHFHGNQEFVTSLQTEVRRSLLGKLYNHLLGSVVNRLQRFAFRHASVVCFVSEFAKKQFLHYQNLESLAEKTRVVPNGVNTQIFSPIPLSIRGRLLAKYGFNPKRDFLILFSGRIDEKKGIMQLVKALCYLPNSYKLIIVHPALRERQSFHHYNALVKVIRSSSLENRVRFVENPKNIATYYQITNCTILPSEREYFSLVILESFASGTIFLGTSVGFIPEFLSDVDQDLIITSTTPHELVKRIRWVSSLSQQKREAIIRRGMEKARGFTWQNAAWAILRELRAIQQQ